MKSKKNMKVDKIEFEKVDKKDKVFKTKRWFCYDWNGDFYDSGRKVVLKENVRYYIIFKGKISEFVEVIGGENEKQT